MAVCYKDILSIDKMIDVYKNIRSNTCHKEKLVRFELAFCCNLTTILEKLENKTYQHRLEELLKIPRYKKGKGLPIGNETSQILAIYYLNSLDHYIKEQLHIKCYVRYMDDFILFHHDKDYLKQCLVKIEQELKLLKLSLNRKTQIYDLEKGFNFLGYKFVLKNKKLLILLNNQTKKKIKKKLRRLKKHQASNYQAVKTSYQGYFQVANTKHFLYQSKF